jgi:hypothetical protein
VSPIDDIDLDLLADHAAGLLDPAEQTRVARLIETDPAWAQVAAELTAAQPRLDAALAGLAGELSMPVDIADRLDAMLATQAPLKSAGRTATTRVADAADRAVDGLSAAGERGGVTSGPGARTRKVIRGPWRRAGAGALAVAAAVAAVFLGLNLVSVDQGGSRTSAPAGGSADQGLRPNAAAPYSATVAGSLPPMLHTGTDYTPQNLGSAAAAAAVPGAKDAAGAPGSHSELSPLDSAALPACLAGLVARYGGQPALVDYARYQGQPALIVVLIDGSTRRVVAVLPSCGQPSAGTAELYSVTQ